MSITQSELENLIRTGGEAFTRFIDSTPSSPFKSTVSTLLLTDSPLFRLQAAQMLAVGLSQNKSFDSRRELAEAVLAVATEHLQTNENNETIQNIYASAASTAAVVAKETSNLTRCKAVVREGVARINAFSNPSSMQLENRESLYMALAELYMDHGDIDGASVVINKITTNVLSPMQGINFKALQTRLANMTGSIDDSSNEIDVKKLREQVDQIEKVLDFLPLLPMAPTGLAEELRDLVHRLKTAEQLDLDLAVELQEKLETIQSLMRK